MVPCVPSDLPQTLLEPLLIRYATLNGFKCRWNTTFLSLQRDSTDSGPTTTTVQDDLTGQTYQIRSKFLFGADGARSRVVEQIDLPLRVKPGQGLALNVLVKADLTRLVENRKGNLHWIMQPGHDNPDFGWIGIVRMVKPWHEWMFIMFPKAGMELKVRPSNEELLQRVKEFIGDDSIPAEILGVSRWYINETVAEQYSRGNVYVHGSLVRKIQANGN
ncbi:uncharacterized protein N0V89_001686 [Didymosphaeria variabile]|uniref:FAD-binding domain-containing protein n=1 Tax=Didymosphaeria variabile TaxID=1932322 RepID=A0A9W8XWM5_9PLEO|nr:uncharacterized protein N0V89_001686 [Didymosphaeria variabile]KAJ4361117.1 hypothetical protein N0V89_001686 [Didymosphaeria variabile]